MTPYYEREENLEMVNSDNLKLLNRYLNKQKSAFCISTRNTYKSMLIKYFIYILKHYDNLYVFDYDPGVSSDIIDDFIAEIIRTDDNTEAYIRQHIMCLQKFYSFYINRGKYKVNPILLWERPKYSNGRYTYERVFLTVEQIEKIRDKIDELENIQLNLLFELIIFTMARKPALVNMLTDQVDLDAMIIRDVRERDGYSVNFFLNYRTAELILEWFKEREKFGIRSRYLFCTRTGGKATDVINGWWVKSIGQLIGISRLTINDLRHSAKSIRREMGMSYSAVSKMLNPKAMGLKQQLSYDEDYEELHFESLKYQV